MRQVEAVAARVTELCAAHDVQPLHVNVLGLSRGGIAAYMLARHVSGLKCASRLRLNLCVFDPVPGNLVSTAKYLDLFGNVTTANRHIDLRSCRIVRCLALYPADPLPDLAFHAPLLPDYPKGCEVEEDATLGCHQACPLCAHGITMVYPRHCARAGPQPALPHHTPNFVLHGAPHGVCAAYNGRPPCLTLTLNQPQP